MGRDKLRARWLCGLRHLGLPFPSASDHEAWRNGKAWRCANPEGFSDQSDAHQTLLRLEQKKEIEVRTG